MALRKHINPFSRANNDTGFGTKPENYGGRFINKDGSYNIHKQGTSIWQRFSIYQTMLAIPRWKFAIALLLCFIIANIFFTLLYILFGWQSFQGFLTNSAWGKIKELFFFSTETFTTVGYGRINPVGDGVNMVAAFEAMTGFLSFAIATGLMYGRFSKAKAHINYSSHALIGKYKDHTGLMFRLVSHKSKHSLTEVTIKVNVSLKINENGESVYRFYDLPLERNRIDSLMMNWTVVHPITENSPLWGLSAEEMKVADLELYVLLRGFDDVYSNNVLKRTSYTYDEIVFNAKFIQMYHESADGKATILELDKLNLYDPY